MPDFSVRTLLPEKMDQPGVPEPQTGQALKELEIINRRLGGYHVILDALEQLKLPDRLISIIDLGSGGGDVLRRISKWAGRNRKAVMLTGIDMNPVMTAYAGSKSTGYPHTNFLTMNVFDDALLSHKADIVMSSLFCHHFDNDELVELVRRMYRISTLAVIINDLHRNWFAYYSIKLITYFFSRTFLVRYDAPLSVARSLSRAEWKTVLESAGISNYRLKWMWAWRWQLIILKNENE